MLLGEFVKNNAPDFCEVSMIHKGNKVDVNQQVDGPTTPESTRHFEKTLLFSCFPGKFNSEIYYFYIYRLHIYCHQVLQY